MRLHSVTRTIENGFVHLPDKAEWLAEYLHEMTSFPKGKFDDQCDSTSQALDWIKSGSKYDGFFKWLKLESDKAKKGTFGATVLFLHVPHARANQSQTLARSFAASIAAISGGKPDALFLSRPGQRFSLVDIGCEPTDSLS